MVSMWTCGELFIGGQKRKDHAAQISISTIGFNLEELPKKQQIRFMKNLMAENYAVSFQQIMKKTINNSIWKPKFLNARNGILLNQRNSDEDIFGFTLNPKIRKQLNEQVVPYQSNAHVVQQIIKVVFIIIFVLHLQFVHFVVVLQKLHSY